MNPSKNTPHASLNHRPGKLVPTSTCTAALTCRRLTVEVTTKIQGRSRTDDTRLDATVLLHILTPENVFCHALAMPLSTNG